ncbi:MAG: hypothetical protein V2A34_03015 [Lentisphaerota bacterium]
MKVWTWMILGLLVAGVQFTSGDTIWYEDFSDVSDWFIVADPMGDGTMSSDGSYGTFSEPSSAESGLTFAPTTRATFDPAMKATYSMDITIQSLTGSASHKWAIDEWNSAGTYVGTVWNVWPTGESDRSIVGFAPAGPVTTNINLGAYTFDSSAAYIAPKFDLSTGDGGQSLVLDNLSITQTIPEPATMNLIGIMIGSVLLVTRKRLFHK